MTEKHHGIAQVVGTSKMHSYGLIDYNLNYQVRPSFHNIQLSISMMLFRSLSLLASGGAFARPGPVWQLKGDRCGCCRNAGLESRSLILHPIPC